MRSSDYVLELGPGNIDRSFATCKDVLFHHILGLTTERMRLQYVPPAFSS